MKGGLSDRISLSATLSSLELLLHHADSLKCDVREAAVLNACPPKRFEKLHGESSPGYGLGFPGSARDRLSGEKDAEKERVRAAIDWNRTVYKGDSIQEVH